MAVQSKVMVITGGPGVGKTTLLKAIVQVLRAKQMRLAKRLSEATGMEATTQSCMILSTVLLIPCLAL